MSGLDVARIRAAFPALTPPEPLARFDAPGGSLVPRVVAGAVAEAMTAGMCQRGTATAPQRRTEATVAAAREAMAALLGADPRGIVFGRSMTAIAFDLARTLSADWAPGDEVVVSRLDHDADVRPWVIAAERAGASVRWLGFDPVTGELDDPAPLVSERTRLLAVTAASNLIGTRPDVAAAAGTAHERSGGRALVHVDAVHLAPHAVVELPALGADLLTCSPYKFFGPHLGVLAADPALLESLHPEKLLPSTDAVPERFELGTLPYEQLAGVSAAVEFIASWSGSEGDLRARVVASMTAAAAHEEALLERLLAGLEHLPRVRVVGTPSHRTPTVLLTVDDVAASVVSQALAERGVLAPAGTFYAHETAAHLGLDPEGGVRVGLSVYNDDTDVDRLLEGLAALGVVRPTAPR